MTADRLALRTTTEVFDDHLEIRRRGHDWIEADIERNYADDVVILTNYGTFCGHDGVRRCAAILRDQVPSTDYEYTLRRVANNIAYLEWTAPNVGDGVDTFAIRDGKIRVQTIRYTADER